MAAGRSTYRRSTPMELAQPNRSTRSRSRAGPAVRTTADACDGRATMKTVQAGALTHAIMLAAGACRSSPEPANAPTPAEAAPGETDTASAPQEIFTIGAPLSPVEPGTYFIDADLDASTSLRAVFDIPGEGWSSWLGAAKFGPDGGHVGMSITTVVNLVTDGCRDHLAADP